MFVCVDSRVQLRMHTQVAALEAAASRLAGTAERRAELEARLEELKAGAAEVERLSRQISSQAGTELALAKLRARHAELAEKVREGFGEGVASVCAPTARGCDGVMRPPVCGPGPLAKWCGSNSSALPTHHLKQW